MCNQCKLIVRQIARYREFRLQIDDWHTLQGIKLLIQHLKAEKKALHPAKGSDDN